MKKKILISTGGSGGHVIPAIAFYDHLKENFEVFYKLFHFITFLLSSFLFSDSKFTSHNCSKL